MTKTIRIFDAGHVWHVPLEAIAKHRADYYAKNDKDTTFKEEFDFVMSDGDEGVEWFLNNMDFEDVQKEAKLVATPPPLLKPRINSDSCEVDLIET